MATQTTNQDPPAAATNTLGASQVEVEERAATAAADEERSKKAAAAAPSSPEPSITVVPAHEYKAAQRATTLSQAAANPMNETVEGGAYQVEGRWVNANGEPVAKPKA